MIPTTKAERKQRSVSSSGIDLKTVTAFATPLNLDLAGSCNTRYTTPSVTEKAISKIGSRVGAAGAPATSQADEPARSHLAQITEARGCSDQELGLRPSC